MAVVRARRMAAELVERGVTEVRLMARTNKVFLDGDVADPDRPTDTDVLARIHMIMDVCHGLTNVVSGYNFLIERATRSAIRYRWGVAGDGGREWMMSRARILGPSYLERLRRCVGVAELDPHAPPTTPS